MDLLNLLRAWSMTSTVDHLSIVGEFGQGKSTALLAFCAEWAGRWISGNRTDKIPLLIELRGKSPKRQAPDRFLAEWGDRYGLSGGALLSLIQSGRAIIIFEGFDEIQEAGLRFDRIEQFKALWAFSYPGAKIIFTGRPNFFLDTSELANLLLANSTARDAGVVNSRVLSLCFLDEQGIMAGLSKYSDQIRSEILSQCRRDPAFFDISKRPSMLPVIGNQWNRIKSQLTIEGGITSAAILRYFIDFLYARKEADLDRLGQFQLLDRTIRHYFTRRVAWTMAKLGLKNTVTQDIFVRAIEEAYTDLDSEFRMEPGADSVTADAIRRIEEKFKGRPRSEVVASIATDVRTNGLFAPDPAGGRDNLFFPHKQYFEFMIAEIFVEAMERRKRTSWINRLSRKEIENVVNFEPVSLFLGSGLVNYEDISDYKQFRKDLFSRVTLSALASMLVFVSYRFFGLGAKNNYGIVYNIVRICRNRSHPPSRNEAIGCVLGCFGAGA